MLRLLILLVIFMVGLLAFTPIYLKPEALTNCLGEINLIEDALIVQYPYTPLLSTTSTIKVVSETLLKLSEATRINKTKTKTDSNAVKLLNLLWDRLVFLQGKVDQANTDYSLHPAHSRVKRSLLNIFGKASKYLFGTITEDDIHDLRNHHTCTLPLRLYKFLSTSYTYIISTIRVWAARIRVSECPHYSRCTVF